MTVACDSALTFHLHEGKKREKKTKKTHENPLNGSAGERGVRKGDREANTRRKRLSGRTEPGV